METALRCVESMFFPKSRSEWFDLIVVGAGPAGSMAALSAQKSGVKTLLIEREREVGSNVICGEGVSSWIFKHFLRFNPRFISSRVTGAIFRLQDWRAFKVYFPEAGWILDRKIFDRELSRMAESAGATLLTGAVATDPVVEDGSVVGVRVEMESEERHYFAPIVVGADGISSLVGRWVGLNTVLGLEEIVSCAQWVVSSSEISDNIVEFVIGPEVAPGGYAWIFPKAAGLANVGVGISPVLTERRASDFLADFVSRRFKKVRVLERKSGGVSGVFRGEIAKENVLLCGDAARVGDPFSGAGIYNAVATGVLAGEAVAEAKPTKLASEYKKRVLKKLRRELKLNEELRNIYLELDYAQLAELWEFGKRRFSDRSIGSVHPFRIISSFLFTHPDYLKYTLRLLRAGF